MNVQNTISEQYIALCQRLGDATYKRSVLDQEIQELKNQLQGLNLVNASLAPKNSFLEKRKQESGAQSVERVNSVPVLA